MTQLKSTYGIRYWIVLALAAWLMDCMAPARAEEMPSKICCDAIQAGVDSPGGNTGRLD